MKDIGDQWVFQPATEKGQILKEFRDEAPVYEENLRQWGYRTPKDSLEILERFVDKTARILQAGCGTGLPDQEHYRAGFKNQYGCDFSDEMIELAREKGVHKGLFKTNLEERLPFEDGEFDCVTCLATLTYILDSEQTLREFIRITRKGGFILLSHRNDLFEKRDFGLLCKKLESEGLWKEEYRSGWKPYLPGHETYVREGIKVGYFLFSVR